MSEESEVLKEVCRRLETARIPYMITGSVAANFYGVPRMTRDIDMVIEIRKEDVSRLVGVFKDDFYIDQDGVLDALKNQGMFNIIHNKYVIKVDFIIRKDTAYRALEFQRKRSVEFERQPVWMVSPEDLILSKLAWAKDSLSDMQLRDVSNLLGTVKGMDFQYLEQWVDSLGLQDMYRKAKV